jgi:hypothetical protein
LIWFATFESRRNSWTYFLHHWYRILVWTERAWTEKHSRLVWLNSDLLNRYSLFYVTSIPWASWTLSRNYYATLLSYSWLVFLFFFSFSRDRIIIILQKVLITHLLWWFCGILNRRKLTHFQRLLSFPYYWILKIKKIVFITSFFFLNCVILIII